jgi:hypothetical protein
VARLNQRHFEHVSRLLQVQRALRYLSLRVGRSTELQPKEAELLEKPVMQLARETQTLLAPGRLHDVLPDPT